MASILIVDCFDSFTHNLHHYLDEISGGEVEVVRYDKFDSKLIQLYSHVVLSPGPGLPKDYPLILDYLKLRPKHQSVLGVCLGHQCLGVVHGSKLKRLEEVKHGQKMLVKPVMPSVLFSGMNTLIETGHYHSWVLDSVCFPEDEFKITSWSPDNLIMSIEHTSKPLYGVQFHPESIMTPVGKNLLKNWLMAATD